MKRKPLSQACLFSAARVLAKTLRPRVSARTLPLFVAPVLAATCAGSALAQSTPSTFTHTATYGSTSLTVNFQLHSVRNTNFTVYTQDASGALASVGTDIARTYLGTVDGRADATAAGYRFADGTVWWKIFFGDGVIWEKTTGSAITKGNASWTPSFPSLQVPAGGAGSSVYGAELGMDADNEYFVECGSDVAKTVAQIEWNVLKTDAIYLRDTAIIMRLGRVIIRTTASVDPYASMTHGSSQMLATVRDQWNNVLPASTHDLAATVGPVGAGAGLAGVGTIGATNRYSTSGSNGTNFEVAFRHEAGHNWGSSHYEGGKPEGGTILSDNSLSRFSSPEVAKIVAQRNKVAGVLENLGPYSIPIPPRANGDGWLYAPGGTSTKTFDVLANDSDSNGQAITIPTFDATSDKGGTITRSVGTGPGGRDQLTYTKPASLSELDTFNYTIVDSAGFRSTAKVSIKSLPSPGTYTLKNVGNSLCLDGMGYTASPSNMGMYAGPNGSDNQKFVLSYVGDYARLKNVATNLFMDSLGNTANASNVGQFSDNASNNQQWTLSTSDGSKIRLTNRANGKNLDGYGFTADGSVPRFETPNTGNNQTWTLAAAP